MLFLFLPVKVEITSRKWGRQAINVLNSSILSYTYLSWDIYVHTKQTTERLLRLADGKSLFKSQEPFVLETEKQRCFLFSFYISHSFLEGFTVRSDASYFQLNKLTSIQFTIICNFSLLLKNKITCIPFRDTVKYLT